MADLSDSEIDRLLSEAEHRLSGKAATETSLAPLPSILESPANSLTASGVDKESAQHPPRAPELAVRVPRLVSRKGKVAKDDAGPNWFNMPRTNLTPELKKDLQLLRMRSILSPGQFFKKDTRKNPVPKFSQVGTIVAGSTDPTSSRLTRKERKRTLVEELLSSDDVMAKFKTRYDKIQEHKTSGKKGHYKKLMAQRRRRG